MKLSTSSQTKVETNIVADSEVAMTFDTSAMAHLTSLMTNLYNDPEGAVFREYVSNGIDAHTAAGSTEKVSVYLPSYETPMFMVQDYGVGMSRETIEQVYSQYGKSTKNQSNDEVGGFGLGCKSALAIASQFTVASVKDGVMTTAVIMSKENSAPILKVANEKAVDKPNGTIVSVPVKDARSFNAKAVQFLPFLADLVDLKNMSFKVPEFSKNLAVDVDDSKITFTSEIYDYVDTPAGEASVRVSNVVVVMGGIRYDVSYGSLSKILGREVYDKLTAFSSDLAIIEVPIGSVRLSPSREGIQFDEETTKFFSNIITSGIDKIVDRITSETVPTISAMNFSDGKDAYNALPAYAKRVVTDITLTNGLTLVSNGRVCGITAVPKIKSLDFVDPSDISKGIKADVKISYIDRDYMYTVEQLALPRRGQSTLYHVVGKPSLVKRHLRTYSNSLNQDDDLYQLQTVTALEEEFDTILLANSPSGRGENDLYTELNGTKTIFEVSFDTFKEMTGHSIRVIDGEVIRETSLEISKKEREEKKAKIDDGTLAPPAPRAKFGYYVLDAENNKAVRKSATEIFKNADENSKFLIIRANTLQKFYEVIKGLDTMYQYITSYNSHTEDKGLPEIFVKVIKDKYPDHTAVFIEHSRKVSSLTDRITAKNSSHSELSFKDSAADLDNLLKDLVESMSVEHFSEINFMKSVSDTLGTSINDLFSGTDDALISDCLDRFAKFNEQISGDAVNGLNLSGYFYSNTLDLMPNLKYINRSIRGNVGKAHNSTMKIKYPFLNLIPNSYSSDVRNVISAKDVVNYIKFVNSTTEEK